MEHKFLIELDGFCNTPTFKILNATTNFLQWFDVLYPQKDKVHWTKEVMNLWEKNSWWVKFSKNWLKKKVRFAP
jgi:hypothetical protein